MKKIASIILLLVSFSMLMAASTEKITVEGELIDVACYVGMDAKGVDHTICAAMCAKKGLPIAVYTKEGEIINLITIPVEFVDVVGSIVKIEGDFHKSSQTLKPTKMWVKANGKWKEHKLPKLMM